MPRRETIETLVSRVAYNPRTNLVLAGLFVAVAAFAAVKMGAPALAATLAAGIAGVLLGARWMPPKPRAFDDVNGATDAGRLAPDIRDIVLALDLPAIIVDADGTIQEFNRPAQALFAQINVGQPLHQVNRNPALLETVKRAQTENAPQSAEMLDRASGGRRLRVTVSGFGKSELPEAESRPALRFLVQLRDLTEQDRLAQLRSDFIANASHELRTPLASLKGFVETLQGAASQDEKARNRFLDIMASQAARMARILDDLLSLSRIEMRAHVRPTDAVDINDIVQASVHGLQPIADDARIDLTFTPAETPATALGDADELEQVFQNLIENAIKYGHSGGSVDVRVRQRATRAGEPGEIIVSVKDDGPGIAEEHLPRLTERFYRVDTATSRERGGTGLGLAIVKHILNRHRGELEIASRVGEGSTFSVVLRATGKS